MMTLVMHTNGTYDDPVWSWKIEANGQVSEHTSFNRMPLAKEFLQAQAH